MHLFFLLPACWLRWCIILPEKDLFHQYLNTDRYSLEIITSLQHVLFVSTQNNHSGMQHIAVLIFFHLHNSICLNFWHLWVQYRDIPFKKIANSCVIRVPFATNSQCRITISPVSLSIHLLRRTIK